MSMKVGFISTRLGGVMRPGLTFLSAALKAAGHQVAYLDASGPEAAEGFVRRERPGLLAYSVTSGEYAFFNDINEKLKPFGLRSLIGGPHATFFGPALMADPRNSFAAACRGEGEDALLEFCAALEEGREPRGLANFIFPRPDGAPEVNPLRPLIADLDRLPFPDFALDPDLARETRARLWLHRGCPFNCTYCMNHVWRKLYRGLGAAVRCPSPARSLAIIQHRLALTPGRVQDIYFQDDTFGHDLAWLAEFGRLYRQKVGLPFLAQLYPAMITRERVRLLAEAGCQIVSTAIETGDETRRRELLKRPLRDATILEGARLVHAHGMGLKIQNILLLPGETRRSAWQTFDLNARCRPEVATTGKFQPYPGIELTEKAIQMGHLERGAFEDRIPDNIHWLSVLKFPDPRMVNEVNNLLNLFTFGTFFTFLRPLVWLLCQLPNGKLHHHIDNVTWRVITHRPDREARPGALWRLKLLGRFLRAFCSPREIAYTLKRRISPVMNLRGAAAKVVATEK